VTLLTNFSAKEVFPAVLFLDSANECLMDARANIRKAANMNGRAIPLAYLFRLSVCDKEMS
jgi:hypothetical protein